MTSKPITGSDIERLVRLGISYCEVLVHDCAPTYSMSAAIARTRKAVPLVGIYVSVTQDDIHLDTGFLDSRQGMMSIEISNCT